MLPVIDLLPPCSRYGPVQVISCFKKCFYFPALTGVSIHLTVYKIWVQTDRRLHFSLTRELRHSGNLQLHTKYEQIVSERTRNVLNVKRRHNLERKGPFIYHFIFYLFFILLLAILAAHSSKSNIYYQKTRIPFYVVIQVIFCIIVAIVASSALIGQNKSAV